MRTDRGLEEVIARLRSRSLSVCDSCDGQGYTDMGKSACFWCRGAGVITIQMAHAFGIADRQERALTPPDDRDLCECRIGQCRALTERCRDVEK